MAIEKPCGRMILDVGHIRLSLAPRQALEGYSLGAFATDVPEDWLGRAGLAPSYTRLC